jgi:geranylgeranyl diphosphate synthase type II
MRAELAFNFETYHADRQKLIEKRLAQYLASDDPSNLWESMRYSVLSGGKRIRATLCLAAAEAVEASGLGQSDGGFDALSTALPCACAIEMVHAMSLMHDDLPCMDDDDFRRGKPSNHKFFGEAIALLAGDNLLVYAFETILAHTQAVDLSKTLLVCRELAAATGARGMVGGQVLDMALTGQGASLATTEQNAHQLSQILSQIHERKTGALIRFSVWSGACLMGASDNTLVRLGRFGEILGLSFQIADDLLDVSGDIKTLGKTPGKDQASGKLTWISAYGEEAARQKLNELEAEGQELLKQSELTESALKPLNSLLSYAIRRTH